MNSRDAQEQDVADEDARFGRAFYTATTKVELEKDYEKLPNGQLRMRGSPSVNNKPCRKRLIRNA